MSPEASVIHFIQTSGIGGAESVLLNIVSHLDRSRFSAHVVLLEPGWLSQELEVRNITHDILASNRSLDMGLILRLRAVIRRRGADLIHCHLPDSNAYGVLAALGTGTPAIATYHGLLSHSPGLSSRERFKLFLVRHLSRAVVTVSESLKRELVNIASFPERKITAIHNGVQWVAFDRPLDIAAKRLALRLEPGRRVVGIVANMRPAKGLVYFIRAARRIAAEIPDVEFLIVGEEASAMKEALLEETSAPGAVARIRFLGYRDDVPEILRTLDVFVLSSLSEGMSIATVEAMGAGVPVVVTRSGGPEELVEDGVTGFLVPPADDLALSEKVLFLLHNPAHASAMAERARASARVRFGVEKMIRSYEALYEECLR